MQKKSIVNGQLYKNPFSVSYWKDAASQLGNIRILCIAAVLIAVRVALKSTGIQVGENLTIYIGFFVNALGAMIFGPVVAAIAAAISDTLGALLFPGNGVYYFPFIFVEISGSVIFALWLWRAKLSATRIILSRFCVSFFCNLILNPIIMIYYYEWLNNGKTYKFITLPRIIKNLALFPAEALLLVLFIGAMTPALASLKLIPKDQTKPTLTKKNLILVAALFAVAAAFVILYYFVWLAGK